MVSLGGISLVVQKSPSEEPWYLKSRLNALIFSWRHAPTVHILAYVTSTRKSRSVQFYCIRCTEKVLLVLIDGLFDYGIGPRLVKQAMDP